MRILFISAEPVRLRHASDTHVNEVVRHLRSAGHEVTICTTQVTGPYDSTSLLRRCAAYLVFWIQTFRQLRGGQHVYARAHPANFPIALAAWLRRIPIVHEINGCYNDIVLTHSWLSPFMGLIATLSRFQYRKASMLITVTSGLADWARKEAPGVPIAMISNGANCAIFCPERSPVKAVARDYALFFGSLTRWHGIETMIAAVENEAWPADIDLVFIGEGQLRPMVQQASARNSKIHILASVPQDLLAGYITGAVAGLVPMNSFGDRSRFGLSPLKLYEMLACGLPIIATDVPEQGDLVRSLDAGVVIPPDDPAALAKAVAQMRANPPAREKMMKVASIIKAEYSWSHQVAKIEKVLAHVAAQSKL